MIDDKTQNLTGFNLFKKYCFIYKVESFEIKSEKNNYFEVNYKFYDKKFKKDSKQLYTFYISKTKEFIKFSQSKKIVFPYPFFIEIRKSIENHKTNDLKKIIKKMMLIDEKNQDLIVLKKRLFLN